MATNDYLLVRSVAETERTVGYLIHPAILKYLPRNARIADIATGTGIWALDTAKILPEASIDAIDISSSQFPLHEARPTNVRFSIHDARQVFISSYQGQYDLVHIRAVVAGMNREDWQMVVANVMQLLKPGGALQWAEADLQRLKVFRGSDSFARYKVLPKLLGKWDSVLSARDLTGPMRLAHLIEHAGGSDIVIDTVSSDRLPKHRSTVTMNYVDAILGWAASENSGFKEDILQLRQAIKNEISDGAYVRVDNFIITAKRPVSRDGQNRRNNDPMKTLVSML